MKIRLSFEVGYGIYDEQGVLKKFVFTENNGERVTLTEEDGCPGIQGVWDEETKKSEPWESVVKKIAAGTYKLPKGAIMDNGQVTDEGLIKGFKLYKR